MVVGLRTVSSLSTESSTNSVCSTDGFTTSSSSNNNMVAAHQLHQQLNNPNSVCSNDGFSSVQDALSRLNQAGFDEVSQMEHFRFRVQHCCVNSILINQDWVGGPLGNGMSL